MNKSNFLLNYDIVRHKSNYKRKLHLEKKLIVCDGQLVVGAGEAAQEKWMAESIIIF